MSLLGGGLGGIFGAITGGLAANEQRGRESQVRNRIRRASAQSQAEARADLFETLSSPQYQAYQNFLGGIFGFQPQDPRTALGEAFSGGGFFQGVDPSGSAVKGKAKREATNLGRQTRRVLAGQQRAERQLDTEILRQVGPEADESTRAAARAEILASRPGLERNLSPDNLQNLASRFNEFTGEQREQALRHMGGFGISDLGQFSPEPRVATQTLADGEGPGLNPLAQDVMRGLQQAQGTNRLQGRAATIAQGLGGGIAQFQTQLGLLGSLPGAALFPRTTFDAFEAASFGRESRSVSPALFQAPTGFEGSLLGAQSGFSGGLAAGGGGGGLGLLGGLI